MFIFVFTCIFQCSVLYRYQGGPLLKGFYHCKKRIFEFSLKQAHFATFFICLFVFQIKNLVPTLSKFTCYALGVGRLPLGRQSSFNQAMHTGFMVASNACQRQQWRKEFQGLKLFLLSKEILRYCFENLPWMALAPRSQTYSKYFVMYYTNFSVILLLLSYISHSGSELLILNNYCYLPHLKTFTIIQIVEWICLCIAYLLVSRKTELPPYLVA